MPSNKDKVQDFLLSLPEIRVAGLEAFEAIPTGTTNQNWKVRTQQGVWVVRKNAENVPGVDRHIEARVLRMIEPLQIAPKLIAVDPERGYLITEYLDLPTWTADDCANPELQSRLFDALKPVHALELNETAVGVKTRAQQYFSLAGAQAGQNVAKLAELLGAVEKLGFFELQRLCHYDLNHTNIVGYEDIKILDWEFAGMAHPILDVAVFGLYEQIREINTDYDEQLFLQTTHLVRLMFELWQKSIPK